MLPSIISSENLITISSTVSWVTLLQGDFLWSSNPGYEQMCYFMPIAFSALLQILLSLPSLQFAQFTQSFHIMQNKESYLSWYWGLKKWNCEFKELMGSKLEFWRVQIFWLFNIPIVFFHFWNRGSARGTRGRKCKCADSVKQ